MKEKQILTARKKFRRVLYLLVALSFLFAATMSAAYVSHRHGYIEHNDIAPTVFTADAVLYQTRAYWSENPEKYEIAKRLIRMGFYSRIYSQAGDDIMNDMADEGYKPAVEYVALKQ